MNQLHHWLCALSDTVDPTYFWPPTPESNQFIARLTAFHESLTEPVTFERAGLGEVWRRTG